MPYPLYVRNVLLQLITTAKVLVTAFSMITLQYSHLVHELHTLMHINTTLTYCLYYLNVMCQRNSGYQH